MIRPGRPARNRALVTAATGAAALCVVAMAVAAWGPAGAVAGYEVLVLPLDLVSVVLGWLVLRGAPTSAVGPALAWTGGSTLVVRTVEVWGLTAGSPAPWWGAEAVAWVGPGIWPWQLMGFFALVLVFPDGLLPGRRWRLVAVAGPVAAVLITATQAGGEPEETLVGWRLALALVPLPVLLAALLAAVGGLVVRHRRGDEVAQLQLRWLLLAAGTVPVLLAAGWGAQALGVPVEVAYPGFLVGMLVLVPAAVAVAVLRYDLLDIDRLVSSALAGAVTAVVSAALFALVVWFAGAGLSAPGGLGSAAAAFVTALCLLPVHHRLRAVVGRLTDRERTVALGAVRRYVEQVRHGTAQPEAVEQVLRTALRDPGLRLALRLPGVAELVDLDGEPVSLTGPAVVLRGDDAEVGALLIGRSSARRRRLATEAALAARLPIEVSRLRLELRATLAEVTASRARLVEAASVERRRLERDLHDGAQQRVVAVGMRLRSLQHRLDDGADVRTELDQAVGALEDTIAELRRVAQGVRPSRLDDGLAAALQGMARDSPLPLRLSVQDPAPGELDESAEATAYFVVAEAVANAWKHSGAQEVTVHVGRDAGRTVVEVCDDGVGGVDPARSLTALRDRVGSVGGRLDVLSPPGGGTRVRAVL